MEAAKINMVSDLPHQFVPVHFAVRLQSSEILQRLLNSNADVNEVDDLENTPVHIAIELENLKLLRMLVDAGAKLNQWCGHGYTPMHFAAAKSKILDVFWVLLVAGADVNSRSTYGNYTPLHVATESAKACCILKLLQDPKDNSTLYEEAKESEGAEVLRELFNVQNGEEYSPALFSFADVSKNLEILKLLLDCGADVNARDENGHTALHMAADFGDVRILKLLVEYGADMNAITNDGNTPLHYAISKDNVANATYLVDAGVDVNWKNVYGDTALHIATFSNEFYIIKILIRAGADVNERTCLEDHTSFTYFVKSLNLKSRIKKKYLSEDMVRFMMDYADVNLVDAYGVNMLARVMNYSYMERKKFFFKAVYEHIAKLMVLGLYVHPSFVGFISAKYEPRLNYFKDCVEELERAKVTRVIDSELTYFDLLVDDKPNFVKYVENLKMVRSFRKSKDFPIYKNWMQINISQGVEGRKLIELATIALSKRLIILTSKRKIVTDILHTLSERDLKRLAGEFLIDFGITNL